MSSRSKAVVLVAVAFVAGLFVGIAGDHLVLLHSGRLFPRRGAEFASRRLVDHLNRELHLSDAQRTAIQRIVDQHHARIELVWNNVRPQVRHEIDAANTEIEKLLTPQQRSRYRELRSHDSRRGHHGPPPY